MKRRGMLLLFALLAISSLLLAEETLIEKDGANFLTLDLEMRARYELDAKDFNNDTGWSDLGTLRTMVGFRITPAENVLIRTQFKESRIMGVEGNNKIPGAEVTFQESYLKLTELSGSSIALQAGRFEMEAGRGRILGAGDWNTYGRRTYDGLQMELKAFSGIWEIAAVRLVDYDQAALINTIYGTNYSTDRADRNLFAIRGSLLQGKLQPILTADIDNSSPESTQYNTVGFHANQTWSNTKVYLDAAWQFGNCNGRDLSSWLFAAEVSHKLNQKGKPSIGAGLDMTSGNAYDEDGATDEDHVFYAPYMRRHRFRGYMDFFRDVRRGMVDGFLRLGFNPGKARLQLDIHNFSYLQNDALNPGAASPEEFTQLGQEFDLRFQWPLAKQVKLDAAYCLFLASDSWVPDGNPGHFIYIAAIATL